MVTAGVVLVGGRSSRMGSAKAGLEWHGSTLLRRVSGLVARAADGLVIVVRAPGQPLPEPVPGALLVADPRPGLGPLVGLATGLCAAAEAGAELAFVAATDLPFLHPALVRRVLAELSDPAGDSPEREIAWPLVAGFPQPLAAAYRTALAPALDELAAGGERRLRALAHRFRVREVDAAALLTDPGLAEVDPELASVRNVNSPADYTEARSRPAPEITVRVVGRTTRVRAATLGAAAEACGAAPIPPASATVREASGRGEIVSQDGQFPLAAGDTVEFSGGTVQFSGGTVELSRSRPTPQ